MSSVSSVGGGAQGIYQFIQSLTGASPSAATGAASGTSSSAIQTIAQAAQSIGQAMQGGGHHHHHGGALKQIQDSVTNALQSAQSNGSTANPNKIVEDAISQVLGNNNAAVSPTGTDADGDGDGSGGSTPTSAAAKTQAFFQTLQSFGVSPQQFKQDLLSAVKDAQNGTVNSSTAFQNFPVGSALDAIG
jgi:hypothetical protein